MRICLLSLLLLWPLTLRGEEQEPIDFAHQIVPLLKMHCVKCHGGTQKEGAFSLNTRDSMIAGGESGAGVEIGNHADSELYLRITAESEFERMPPEGDPLSAEESALIARWIDRGARWEPGFTFGVDAYEPPLRPRRPSLPEAQGDRTHPIDRLLDRRLREAGQPPPEPLGDEAFLRRVYLDLIGLLPSPAERAEFLNEPAADKRAALVQRLLSRDVDYAEHWLTFWNDLLRNDYAGTGFITGGRKQITGWLYDALLTNKPYDQFVGELIAPPSEASAGFADGIRWRGEVSAGQQVEIQFAQNVGQVFLGINLKCASCHDSFIDRWKLEDAYGLAAVYAQKPLELHRCDKPLGKIAEASWLFDELGEIEADAPREARLRQLAALLTHDENGRFARTIVNRLWHRLMGRGIVHPTDAMQTEPWDEDLLDFLASYLVDHDHDLKQVLAFIATSRAYQSQAESVEESSDSESYRYAGPRSKRLTAEQFVDCIWQLTGAAPDRFDAEVIRAPAGDLDESIPLVGRWIWNRADADRAAAGETIAFRKQWQLDGVPDDAVAVVSCDNQYTLFVNGKPLQRGKAWNAPDLVPLTHLKAGTNEIVIVAHNGGNAPNPAGLFFEARWTNDAGQTLQSGSDTRWQWTAELPGGKPALPPADATWQPAVAVSQPGIWMGQLAGVLREKLHRGRLAQEKIVRAALLKSDFLMRSLGRPNRDQVVTVRPLELTTLEAIDLSIGKTLIEYLRRGAEQLSRRQWNDNTELIRWLYHYALSRDPTTAELDLLTRALGPQPSAASIEDVLWAVVMLPEFQIVR